MGDNGKLKRRYGLNYKKEVSVKDTWQNRSMRLSELGITYKEYLQSDEWKRVRQKAKSRDYYKKCLKCGSNKNIHLHHTNYKWLGTKDAMRGLRPLCGDCHHKVHLISKQHGLRLNVATKWFIRGRIDILNPQQTTLF